MTLRQYLAERELSQSQFAAQIGLPRQMVQRYVNGRIPVPKHMAKIVLATGGKVTANDFFGLAA